MEAVVELPEWAEVLERNPSNRQRFLDQDRQEFIAALERWMFAYCPCGDELVPGLSDDAARGLDLPALVFRSGESDAHHTRRRRSGSRSCSRTRSSSSRPGATGSGSSVRPRTPPVEGCSRGGHCSHRPC